jgi:hypothetical protein
MRRAWLAGILALGVFGCPKRSDTVEPEVQAAPGTPDAGPSQPTEADLAREKVKTIEAKVAQALTEVEEALWVHWISGAPLDLAKVQAKQDALYSAETLATVRRAQELNADEPRALANLEHHVLGELIARALAEANAAVANLEASLTVSVDGKEIAFRDVGHLLASEKSAVKRKALWADALKSAELLDAQLDARNDKARAVLEPLALPSMLELATETRGLDLDVIAYAADEALQLTDAAWLEVLKRQSDLELKLPVEALRREDLPRLMRVPAEVDQAFPKGQVASRGVALLGELGLYGEPGLTLELAESAKKSPLPLTVEPNGPMDVRVSFQPQGGLRDQALLFSELGHALALRHVTAGRLEYERLGDPGAFDVSAELLAGLMLDEGFVRGLGVPEALVKKVAAAWRAQRLYALRREAGTVLARLETQGLADAEARAKYVEIMSRALRVKLTPADGARHLIDTTDFLRGASSVRAQVAAAALAGRLAQRFGPAWWKTPEAVGALKTVWADGTKNPVDARVPALTYVPALAASLGATVPAEESFATPDFGRELDAVLGAPVSSVKPWPKPERVAPDAGVVAAPDAGPGLVKPWPQAERIAAPADAGP